MKRELKIRDLTLRDGQQSQFATRMTQEQVDRVLPDFKEAGFYAMEVWGGAVPDSVMRYLKENPWTRLETIKAAIDGKSKLTALSRGRNLFGYNPYPDSVIEGFCRNAVQSGIDIMRIFDALNDLDNLQSTIDIVHNNGGMADCAVCYTVDPKWTFGDKLKALLNFKPVPKEVFNIKYFVNKAIELEKMGADIISIKDMAGLITPAKTAELIRELKQNVSKPIDFHSHCTPGYGLASAFAAVINGVDILDTVIWNFAEGPAAPAYELIDILCSKLGIETGVNRERIASINKELYNIRKELADFDKYKDSFPKQFNIAEDELPAEVDSLFDASIEAAQKGDYDKLTELTQAIEAYFNFPAPNEAVRVAQIPGGMYTNMLSQLEALKLGHLFDDVLKMVPKVRWDAGSPPLVTPSSQIVGVQAVNCVIDINKEKPVYTNNSTQFVNLVKGSYGKTPLPINQDFRAKITGNPSEIPYSTEDYTPQTNEMLFDLGDTMLAVNEKEELLLELFPNVAKGFLRGLREAEYVEKPTEYPEDDKEDMMWQNLIDYA